jgi:hypothetical protein
MAQRWNTTSEISTAHLTQVFSGGACNIRDAQGNLVRNAERDAINDWLTEKRIQLFDPQIHPDTHGREYEYTIDHEIEIAARAAAQVSLYEVSPRTFGGVTSFEIALDKYHNEALVIYYSDGDAKKDVLPPHSADGYPLFRPDSLRDNKDVMKAHYQEFIKNANLMRRYLVRFAQDMDALSVTFGEKSYEGDIVVTPDRMHAAEMFEAVVRAASGQRVIVNFTGGEKAQDPKGSPIMLVPKAPREERLLTLLDHYRDEGNNLRRRIAELISVNVFVRVVYTQSAAISALEELLTIKGILK